MFIYKYNSHEIMSLNNGRLIQKYYIYKKCKVIPTHLLLKKVNRQNKHLFKDNEILCFQETWFA